MKTLYTTKEWSIYVKIKLYKPLTWIFLAYLKLVNTTGSLVIENKSLLKENTMVGYWHGDSFCMQMVLSVIAKSYDRINVIVTADKRGDRVFENLITNIIKYSMPNTRAYIDITREEEFIQITLKNVSASELNFSTEEITERFVRGDQSRNTDGSGLGLAIAKSFVELQGGKFRIEVDGDLFKVILQWKGNR